MSIQTGPVWLAKRLVWRGERVLCPVDVDSIEKVVSSLESPDIFMRRTRFMEDNFRKSPEGPPPKIRSSLLMFHWSWREGFWVMIVLDDEFVWSWFCLWRNNVGSGLRTVAGDFEM